MEKRDIDKVHPYPDNAKLHPDKQVSQIAESIKEFGFNQPIVVDRQGFIIVGHGRYLAAKVLGLSEVPVLEVNLDEERTKAYRLADNKLNESDWDMNIVIEELRSLSTPMLELTGFDKDLLLEPDDKDDQIPENAPTRAKLGDLWALGPHRVLCGDSTSPEAVQRLMEGKKADMVFTDPPYGINVVKVDGQIGGDRIGRVGFAGKAKTGSYRPVIGDDKPFEPSHLLKMAPYFIIWGANNFASFLPNYSHWLVWDKKGEMQLKNDFSDCELAWTNFPKKTVKKYIHTWAGMTREGDRKTELLSRVHPTQKPVGLFVDIFQDYTNEGWVVLDPYIGSGSTLIAAEKTGRICYGVELDPKYVDVVLKRWEDYTGKEATKL